MDWGSGVETLSLALPIFHESLLLPPGFFPENEEISTPPPYGLSIVDWNDTKFMRVGQPKLSETFREGLMKKAVCYASKT
jgi:hypothetical protein